MLALSCLFLQFGMHKPVGTKAALGRVHALAQPWAVVAPASSLALTSPLGPCIAISAFSPCFSRLLYPISFCFHLVRLPNNTLFQHSENINWNKSCCYHNMYSRIPFSQRLYWLCMGLMGSSGCRASWPPFLLYLIGQTPIFPTVYGLRVMGLKKKSSTKSLNAII